MLRVDLLHLTVRVIMSTESVTCKSEDFYHELEPEFIPLDVHTAANLGDISYFMEIDMGELPSKLSLSNSSQWTPLMFACARGHALLVNYLLLSGAQKNCKSNSGVTPLMLAVSSGDFSTVESVYDFNELEKKDYRCWTPLFYAVHFTREKCLNFLLTKGANVNIVDYQNETPLMVAIKMGRETMVELLLKYATNLDVVSYKNESALMLADESNNPKIQQMVKSRHEFLKKPAINVTPLKTISFNQHCSPSPIRNELRRQLGQIKLSKSLTYSPNKVSDPKHQKTDRVPTPNWKFSFGKKKFWSPQLKPPKDVEQFLKSLGLEKYWPIFRDEEVDFETLLTFNEENLKELGIKLFGPRKKIYLAIQKFKNRREFF